VPVSQRLRPAGRESHQDIHTGTAQRETEPQDTNAGRDGETEMDRDHQQQRPGSVRQDEGRGIGSCAVWSQRRGL